MPGRLHEHQERFYADWILGRARYAEHSNHAEEGEGHGKQFYFQGAPMTDRQRVILLVEDDDDDAELAVRAFLEAKVQNPLVRVRDGVEALDYIFARGQYSTRDTHELPVFVLLDLNIPKISGLKVLEAIREDERTRRLPVIILTSSGEERDRLGAYDHFANSYVIKPLDYDQFVSASEQLSVYWTMLNTPAPLV
jgi:two-component system response regulator